jgi:hypothetical protein
VLPRKKLKDKDMADKAKGKSYTTATGARQWSKDVNEKGESAKALRAARSRILHDLGKLSSKDFKKKYGVTYTDAVARIHAADSARSSKNIKEISGKKSNSTTEMYDEFEKGDVAKTAKERKKAGYAKGGYVNCGASVKPNGKSKK